MKKVLIFCLILLCALSVFAVDFSAGVALHVSYGEKGYGFNFSKGTWNVPAFLFSISDEKAGAHAKINFNFESLDIDSAIWLYDEFENDNSLKFTLGGLFSFSYKNGLTKTDSYSIIDYNHSDEIIAKAGFAYKPIDCKDFSNANVFVAGSFNYVNETVGVFHIDELTKLKVQDNKPELNYALVETSYGLPLDDWVGTGYSKNCLTDSFGYDESVYFEHWYSDWAKHESGTQCINPSFGVRYKYYTEADMQDENGWYGVALAGGEIYNNDDEKNSKISNLYGECELEFGRNGSEFAGKIVGAEGKFSHKTLVGFEMDWTNGFKFRPELYSKVAYADTISPYLIINFNDAYSNFTADDGIYFNPGFTTSHTLCSLDIGATVGFDSLKHFRWNTQSEFIVRF